MHATGLLLWVLLASALVGCLGQSCGQLQIQCINNATCPTNGICPTNCLCTQANPTTLYCNMGCNTCSCPNGYGSCCTYTAGCPAGKQGKLCYHYCTLTYSALCTNCRTGFYSQANYCNFVCPGTDYQGSTG